MTGKPVVGGRKRLLESVSEDALAQSRGAFGSKSGGTPKLEATVAKLGRMNDPSGWVDVVADTVSELQVETEEADARLELAWIMKVILIVAITRQIKRDPGKNAAFEAKWSQRDSKSGKKGPNGDYSRVILMFGAGVKKSSRNRYATTARYLDEHLQLENEEIRGYLLEHGLKKTVEAARKMFNEEDGSDKSAKSVDDEIIDQEEEVDAGVEVDDLEAELDDIAKWPGVTGSESQNQNEDDALFQEAEEEWAPQNPRIAREFERVKVEDVSSEEYWCEEFEGGTLQREADGTYTIVDLRKISVVIPKPARRGRRPRIGVYQKSHLRV